MQQVRTGVHTHKGGTEIRVAVWLSCGHPVGHLPDMRWILLLLISLFVYSVAEKGFQSYKQREERAMCRYRREVHSSADENRNQDRSR